MTQQEIKPAQIKADGLADGIYAFTVVGGVIVGLAPASTGGGGTNIPVGPTAPADPEINDLWVRTP